jgi:outer membrane protein assembly factor BamB
MKKIATASLFVLSIAILLFSSHITSPHHSAVVGQSEVNGGDQECYHRCDNRTFPTIAKGLALFAGSDGYLQAVDILTGTQKWEFDPKLESSVSFPPFFPLIVDNMAYISLRDTVYSIDLSTGQPKMSFKIEFEVTSDHLLSNKGVLYVGCGDQLYAFEIATGKEKWKINVSEKSPGRTFFWQADGILHALVDEIVLFGQEDGSLYAIDTNTGKQIWKYTALNGGAGFPAIANGVVYVGSSDGDLYALDLKTGETRWRLMTRRGRAHAPAVVGGSVYFASGQYLYAVESDSGRELWEFKTAGYVLGYPIINDEIVCFASHDSKPQVADRDYIQALDVNTGKERWRFEAVPLHWGIAVDAGGVYFGSGPRFFGLDLKTGKEKWLFRIEGEDGINSWPIVVNGAAYFVSQHQILYAIDTKTGALKWKVKAKERPEPQRKIPPSESLSRSEAKMITRRAREIMLAIKNRDMATLSTFVHPGKGVRFSPYWYIQPEAEQVFTRKQIHNLFASKRKYLWGREDASGDPIRLTARQYFKQWVYDRDFLNPRKIDNDESGTTMTSNFDSVYPEAIFISYYDPGEPESGFDWASLFLAFEKKGKTWYLVGIIHNTYTMWEG